MESIDRSTSRESKRPRVFLSYAYEDRAVAEKIVARLKTSGTRILIDTCELKPGDSLVSKIEVALSSSDYVVVLLSPHSVRSNWVRLELASAFSRDMNTRAVTLLPVLIEDCEVPVLLAHLQYFDLRADLEKGINELASSLSSAPKIDFSRLSGQDFELLVSDLLKELGFQIEHPEASKDRGIDIAAISPAPDPFGPGRAQHWLVQVKHYSHGRADLKSIRELTARLATAPENSRGLVVTTGQFTSAVQEWAASEGERGVPFQLIDGTALKRLLLRHPDVARKHFAEA